jgi:hypothetical protein
MATALIGSMLVSGCGKKDPTADELLSNAFGSDEIDSIDMSMNMYLEAQMDMSSLFGSSDSGTSTMMNMSMGIDADIQSINTGVSYIDGNVSISLFGMDMSQGLKSYVVDDGTSQLTYTYDEDSDSWTRTTEDSEADSISGIFSSDSLSAIDASIFDSYEMVEVNKDDTEYTITGVISYANLADKLGSDMSDLLDDYTDDDSYDLSAMTFNSTFIFDRETTLCKEMDFVFDTDSFSSDDVTITALTLNITINQINNVEVVVPQSVIDSAVEDDDVDDDFSLDLDTDDTDTNIFSDDNWSDLQSDSTTTSSDDSTLSQYLFETDYIYTDDMNDILSYYYTTVPDDDIVLALCSLCNYYTYDEFIYYIESYNYWGDNYKDALAVLCDLSGMTASDFEYYGVDASDLQARIDSLDSLR